MPASLANFFASAEASIQSFCDFLWGFPMIILLLGIHIFMTIRTGFVQRKTFKAIKLSFQKDPDAQGDISPFSALTTALASTIGTGNIIGVGTAIALGGPGAVLWTWLTGILGIATKYAECFIAIKYRVQTKDGKMQGGAMYALERGLNMKWLGMIFAALAALAAFGIGAGVQSKAIASTFTTHFGINPWIIGIVIAAVTALVTFGGVKTIARVCDKLVPFMAIFYVLGCIIILYFNHEFLGETISLIIRSAFTTRAASGGFVGSTIMIAARYGIARGLFSNESGMGSAPIVAAAAQSRNPVRQALVASTGTFWDTVVVCLMTGLVLVSSTIANDSINTIDLSGDALTAAAFGQIPYIGTPILLVGIATFAFSTILGWSYYAERCVQYLLGKKALVPYRIIFLIVIVLGAAANLSVVWNLADILNGLMTIPNIIALIMLSGVIAKETKYYLKGDNLDLKDKTPIPVIEK